MRKSFKTMSAPVTSPTVAPGDFLPSPAKARADALSVLADRMDALSTELDAGTAQRSEAARELRGIADGFGAHPTWASAIKLVVAKLESGERIAAGIVDLDAVTLRLREAIRWELMSAPRAEGPDTVKPGHPSYPRAPLRYTQ